MNLAFTFILIVEAIVAAALIGVILMQKSEGGGLGGGGSPTGFLSARGAADFLTRTTAVLATIFVALNVLLAVLASVNHHAARIDASAANAPVAPAALPAAPAPPAAPVGQGTALPAGNGAGGSLSGGLVPGAGNADPLAGAAAPASDNPPANGGTAR